MIAFGQHTIQSDVNIGVSLWIFTFTIVPLSGLLMASYGYILFWVVWEELFNPSSKFCVNTLRCDFQKIKMKKLIRERNVKLIYVQSNLGASPTKKHQAWKIEENLRP